MDTRRSKTWLKSSLDCADVERHRIISAPDKLPAIGGVDQGGTIPFNSIIVQDRPRYVRLYPRLVGILREIGGGLVLKEARF